MGSGPRLCVCAWVDSEGGHGVWPPLKNHKTIGFSSDTGMDLQKKSQGYQASIKCWAIIGTTVFPSTKKKKKKNVAKVGPPLAKLSGSAQNVQTRLSLH